MHPPRLRELILLFEALEVDLVRGVSYHVSLCHHVLLYIMNTLYWIHFQMATDLLTLGGDTSFQSTRDMP